MKNIKSRSLILYRYFWSIFSLFVPLLLAWRSYTGKEVQSRLTERYGIASIPRPEGKLYWLHGISVGEVTSALMLARGLLEAETDAHVLITSGTKTSANILEQRSLALNLSDKIIHQFHPYDHTKWIKRFLKHWQPDLLVITESDIWPNMITITSDSNIKIAMASAQISLKSLKAWTGFFFWLARPVFGCFDAILATDHEQARRFDQLPCKNNIISVGGSMKAAAPPLPDNPALRQTISNTADGRIIVLLASSHKTEENIFIEAVSSIDQTNQILALIAPRHPKRGKSIQKHLHEQDIDAPCQSLGQKPGADTQFWIVDTLGDMGALIRSADIIVLGGGFAPLGGHNPMEMAALGKGVISGKHVQKNATIFDMLRENGGVIFVATENELADAINLLANSSVKHERLNQAAIKTYNEMDKYTSYSAQILLTLLEEEDA